MKTKILIGLIALIGLGIGGFLIYKNISAPKEEVEVPLTIEGKLDCPFECCLDEQYKTKTCSLGYECQENSCETVAQKLKMPETENSHFGFMHPQHNYSEAQNLNVHWERPHPGPFIWDELQKDGGEYDWSFSDNYIKKSQSYNFNIIGTIWPFADWDQKSCHSLEVCRGYGFEGLPPGPPDKLPIYRCKPCDMTVYSSFVQNLVERYDGDGLDDMPGLIYPIKYWEALNEPEIQTKELIFFKGTTDEYFQILKTTYNAVKSADPEAKVLHAGMAGMFKDPLNFWKPIFAQGAGNYFDIANVHSIDADNEDFFAKEMKDFLENYNLTKSIWITEAQYGRGGEVSGEEFDKLLIKSYASAFGNGAEKIFYVGLHTPTPGHPDAALIAQWNQKNPIYYSFKTLVEKIDYFESAEQLAENQYKFTVADKLVYILWGTSAIPSEIAGVVKVTDIKGDEKEMDALSIALTDSPIFLETK